MTSTLKTFNELIVMSLNFFQKRSAKADVEKIRILYSLSSAGTAKDRTKIAFRNYQKKISNNEQLSKKYFSYLDQINLN